MSTFKNIFFNFITNLIFNFTIWSVWWKMFVNQKARIRKNQGQAWWVSIGFWKSISDGSRPCPFVKQISNHKILFRKYTYKLLWFTYIFEVIYHFGFLILIRERDVLRGREENERTSAETEYFKEVYFQNLKFDLTKIKFVIMSTWMHFLIIFFKFFFFCL